MKQDSSVVFPKKTDTPVFEKAKSIKKSAVISTPQTPVNEKPRNPRF